MRAAHLISSRDPVLLSILNDAPLYYMLPLCFMIIDLSALLVYFLAACLISQVRDLVFNVCVLI